MSRFLPDKPNVNFVNSSERLTCKHDDLEGLMVEVQPMRCWHFALDQILVLRSVLQDCGMRAGIVSCKLGTSRTGNNKLQESDEAKTSKARHGAPHERSDDVGLEQFSAQQMLRVKELQMDEE
jgi:hypothetical protein